MAVIIFKLNLIMLYHPLFFCEPRTSWGLSSSLADIYAFWTKSSQITEHVPAVEVSPFFGCVFSIQKSTS